MLSSEVGIVNGTVVQRNEKGGTSKLTYQGLPITIENDEGSIRRWKNNAGQTGKTTMFYRYGYIDGTVELMVKVLIASLVIILMLPMYILLL